MEHKLVIAEKPSVAISIAKVIGAKNKKDGYYEGNGYRVSSCVGHLIQWQIPILTMKSMPNGRLMTCRLFQVNISMKWQRQQRSSCSPKKTDE